MTQNEIDEIKFGTKEFIRPRCELIGQDGNAFVIIGLVGKALRKAGYPDKEKEFRARAFKASSYDELIGSLISEYVEVV
jgi:hypothetical protein